MTKQYFIQLADYNVWANNVVCSWIDKINDEQWNIQIESSFNSIYATVLHVAGSEKLWSERLDSMPTTDILFNTFKGSKSALARIWKEVSEGLRSCLENFDENILTENLSYKNTLGKAFTLPYYQLFAHVFNHSTYHRGQLVTMFRQAGFTEISSTDMTTYFANQAEQKKRESLANAQ
jgi:uncharacterized damage-inducible protein DinB